MNRFHPPARRVGIVPVAVILAVTAALAALAAPSAGQPPSEPAKPAPAGPSAAGLLKQAQDAVQRGRIGEALALATQAVQAEPDNAQARFIRGRLHEESRKFQEAVSDYDQALRLDPAAAHAYHFRGSAQFRLGNIRECVADFDKFLELAPDRAPHHWQRGIALYYAGRFQEGRRQFELHQTVNSNDVENAVWHFLCNARLVGVEKARAALLPIQRDSRVPMMEILELFAGRGSPENVLATAREGDPPAAALNQRLFYAHLYLGLYFEALGDAKQAAEHIRRAATDYLQTHYMGDVALVHDRLRREAAPK